MEQLKDAVIGCGGHAQSHFHMIVDEPRLHLAADRPFAGIFATRTERPELGADHVQASLVLDDGPAKDFAAF